jgi:hypothetical protein
LISRALLALGSITATSCTYSEDLEGKDDDVLFPDLRVSWEAVRTEKAGFISEVPASARGVHGSLAVDFDLTYGEGKSSQDLDALETFEMDDLDVTGPARVSHDYDMWAWSFAARGGFWVEGFFGLEGLGGIAFEHLDVEAKSGGVRVSDNEIYGGPLLGAQISLRPFEWFTLFARGSITFGFFEDLYNLTSGETGISVTPHEHVSIFGGWRWWDLEVDREGEADIQLEMSGPLFGVQVNL